MEQTAETTGQRALWLGVALVAGVAVATVVVLFLSRGDNSATPGAVPTTGSYITMAMRSAEGQSWGLELFPRQPGTFKCVIGGGGLAPGVWVPGTCTTSVSLHGDHEATVRFVELWNAGRFHTSSGQRGELSHTWELTVSRNAPDDHVLRSRDYGDFPPQFVRQPPLNSNPNLAPPRRGGGKSRPALGV